MRSRAERMSLIKAGLLVALAAGMASLPVGCSDDKLPNAGYDNDGGGGFGGVATGPCDDGASRKCGIKLAQHDDIVTCYMGTQTCQNGTWGECGDGSQYMKSVSAPPGVGPGSGPMNALGNCAGNPCDPYCQNYNDDAGINADGGGQPLYTWQGGQITGLPNGLVNKGLIQPCTSGADCQFNTYCWHPKTAATCNHSKCEAGGKLNWNCDPCVKEICKADPSCCNYNHTCSHSICSTGARLVKGCDSASDDCTTKICNIPALAYCCQNNQNWDAACVAAVNTQCGLPCPLPPAGTWTAACVAKVGTVCDAVCGTGSPPPAEGKCKEWLPGETDPTCAGIDLGVDVPCSNNIPVCNHGTVAAPAGIRLVHYPANSNQYPKCDPSQAHPNMYECFTTQPIPPGECTTALQYWNGSAWVAGCDQLVGNREIMVNPAVQSGKPTPAGYAGHVAECSCKDNWSLYSGGTCGPPVCGGDKQIATFKKINYFIQMDRTQSMVNSGIWNPAVTGMTAFFQSAGAAGLGIAMEYFGLAATAPFGNGCAPGNCLSAPCSQPYIPLGTLTAAAAPADAQEQALVQSLINAHPNGSGGSGYGTRIYPALEGALLWAQNMLVSNPAETYDVIMLTDGDPTDCNTSQAANAALAANAFNNFGIKTYMIALPGSHPTFLDAIAAAGGTSTAIDVTAANMATQLTTALNQITGNGVTCSSDLPALNLFDPADVTLTFTPSSGPAVALPKRNDLAACNGNVNTGWYYDNNAAPTKVLLCPKSCTTAQNDPGSTIELALGCPKGGGPKTVTIPYQAQCPPGSKPVWNFFAYNSTTPNTSTIDFRVRSADTQALLSGATWKNLGTAQSTPTDTQVCPLTGPAPCPLDLFATLGSPDQKRAWLELEVTLTPAGGGSPVLNTFDATYSCPPSE